MTTFRASILSITALMLMLAIPATSPALAETVKTDIIYMENGDRVTGEIKEMLQGQLRLNSVSMGTILIKWSDIDRIESTKYIQTELLDGTRYFGQVPRSETARIMTVSAASGDTHDLDHGNVVRLEPIEVRSSFWKKLDNALSVGLTYTKASDVQQYNIRASSEYRTRKFLRSISLDTILTDNGDSNNTTRRGDLTFHYQRFRPNRYFWFGSAAIQTNDELGIDRRYIATGGISRYVWQTQVSEFVLGVGAAGNLEKSIGGDTGGSDNEAAFEGMLRANWSLFRLNSPKSDIDIDFEYFPGISDSGRDRANANVQVRQEFIEDLFWTLSLYGSYDSKPPPGAIGKEDYGIVTSLEYAF